MCSNTNHFRECGKHKTRNRIKLRAMTADEFCLAHSCHSCPEFLPETAERLQSECALYSDWDTPYRNSNDRYILVQADD